MGLNELFVLHERRWREFSYVYPVISRRARGLSIGVNLSPSAACNFDCVYCQVDRTFKRPTTKVDLTVLERELRHLVGDCHKLFGETEFRQAPPEFRRLNDIAFSGDGEPTASPVFPEAARIAAAVRTDCGVTDAKIVIITNACFLTRPAVAETLEFLDGHNGQLWVKLDAGTEEYYRRLNRPSHPLQHVLDNILAVARKRPIVVQSLFPRVDDQPPPAEEIAAYLGRLRWIVQEGGHISLVQLYTVARRPAEANISALSSEELAHIADGVADIGLTAECFI